MNMNITMPTAPIPKIRAQFCMPATLRDRLRAEAEARNMSMSAFVAQVLEQVLPPLPKGKEAKAKA